MTNTKKLSLLIILLFIVLIAATSIVSFTNVAKADDPEMATFLVNIYLGDMVGGYAFDKTISGGPAPVGQEYTYTPGEIEGFTFNPSYPTTWIKDTIKADGTTTFSVYYSRNSYTFARSNSNTSAGTISGTEGGTYKYQTSIEITATPNAGYTFDGWYNGETLVSSDATCKFNMPATNITYVARWSAQTNIPYVVQHYKQNVTATGYDLAYEDNLTGTTGELTEAVAKNYTGFQAQTFSQEAIAGDGSTIIEIRYKRETFTITWNNWNGNFIKNTTVRFEATPEYDGTTPTKVREAYTSTFTGWTPTLAPATQDTSYTAVFEDTPIEYTLTFDAAKGTSISAQKGSTPMASGDKFTIEDTLTFECSLLPGYNTLGFSVTPVDENAFNYNEDTKTIYETYTNVTISTTAIANLDTPYKVYIYKEKLDGTYPDDADIYRELTGTTDTVAEINDVIEGFEIDSLHDGSNISDEIKGDGSLELVAFYKRTLHTIIWQNYDSTELYKLENQKYGASITYGGDTPTKSQKGYSYEFGGWDPEFTDGAIVLGDATYTAQFIETKDKYAIEFNLTAGVNLSVKNALDEDIKSGDLITCEDVLTITYSAMDGYTQDGDINVTGKTDEFDFTAGVLKDVYTDITITYSASANTYKITYNDTSVSPTEVEILFNSKVTLAIPQKDGYYFVCWLYEDHPFTDATGLMLAPYSVVGNIELTPEFSNAHYIITYEGYEELSTEVEYNGSFDLEVVSKEGNVFDYWYYVDGGLDVKLTDSDGHSLAVYHYAFDIEVKAKWIEIEITLDQSSVTIENDISKTTQLTATITPEGSSTVSFTSTNEKAFIVDETGLVTCVGTGRAVIRATLDNGGAYAECAFLSIDKIISNGTVLLYVDINKGVDLDDFAILCSEVDTIGYISSQVLTYLTIPNGYVDRTAMNFEIDKTKTVSEVFKDEDELVINLIYNVGKSKNNIVSYKLSCESAEYDTNVYLKDVIAKEGYKLGKIVVKNEKMVPVTTYQAEKYFVMPNDNAEVDVLLSEVKVDSTTIDKIEVDTPNGIDAEVKIIINSKSVDSFDSKISIIDEKQVIFAANSSFKLGDDDYNYDKEYVVRMPMPKEFINRDGIRVLYNLNGQTYVKQVTIENDEIEFTLMGSGDFVFIANTHESTVYLYWLVILLLFIDTFLGMILLIMAIDYQDALQRRRELNGYSSFLPVLLLGAVIASELAFVVFLGVVLIVELVCIAWLGLKLSNKYFIYTTYNKLSYNPRREYKDAVDKYNKNENKNE
ncbi:MAG: Ig-like domain-containing protein [Clostridiales bacterium]|nr:Ig-like domain-containing protein [Clostridiales bacterium]